MDSADLSGESRRKDDWLDAQTLARLVDPQLLSPVKHRSKLCRRESATVVVCANNESGLRPITSNFRIGRHPTGLPR
jgi:hypothetical protein